MLAQLTLLEVLILIGILILVVGMLVAALSTAAGRATRRTINYLVKAGCVEGNQGQFDIQLTQIDQTILDVLTQGFSLETVRAKVKWRKSGNRCVYKIEISGEAGGAHLSRESDEIEVRPCP